MISRNRNSVADRGRKVSIQKVMAAEQLHAERLACFQWLRVKCKQHREREIDNVKRGEIYYHKRLIFLDEYMGLFVSLLINPVKCQPDCLLCEEVCPVDVFVKSENLIMAVKEREDECTLCNLCVEKCPTKAIIIQKHY